MARNTNTMNTTDYIIWMEYNDSYSMNLSSLLTTEIMPQRVNADMDNNEITIEQRNVNANVNSPMSSAAQLQISLYVVIFLLSVIGNSLVILTLAQNRRMRTITNIFLLNLAVSDFLLGVLCMPFTLVGSLLRDFVFGKVMCKFLPYLQASSVSVSAWTLVAISVERYYAICHPLVSRRWQTLSHARRVIAAVWFGSFLFMSPIALLSELIPTSQGHHKCREQWPDHTNYERIFNIFLDIILLIIPLLILGITYSLITQTLWQGMCAEKSMQNATSMAAGGDNAEPCNSNTEKSLLKKKRVVQMLFVVVLEFFLCWTPLYIINTITLFDADVIYKNMGYTAISFFQLLAYSSSCCNPITYCFMNCGFRGAFSKSFRRLRRTTTARKSSMAQPVSEIEISKIQRRQSVSS